MGRQLGTEVRPELSRRELSEPALRSANLVAGLVARGVLDSTLRIPGAVGGVTVSADLRAGRLSCSVDIDAPRDGRPLTRVNWLVRQLKAAPDALRVDAFAQYSRGASTSELLRDVRTNPGLLVGDAKRELRTFRLTLNGPMGTKRGQGRGSFVASVIELLDAFYADVVQIIKPWSTPKLREEAVVPDKPYDTPPVLVSTALSSQDGSTPADEASSAPDSMPGTPMQEFD
jgi:hypothetical protein